MTELESPQRGWGLRDASADAAGRKNMLLLIQLRWLAVAGQLTTILIVYFGMGINLPLPYMLLVLFAAVALNLISLVVVRRRKNVSNAELFLALMFDVVALTIQLSLSGGSSNPFVSLYLLQAVLGAILLDRKSAWGIVAVTAIFVALLSHFRIPLALPASSSSDFFRLHIVGTWICYALIATLLVLFVTRINRNLKERDTHLADLRQRAAEEDHIVRMGLLASGAAHELGTPLSSLSVILSDWHRMPELSRNPQFVGEIEEMQAEVQRCKTIVTGILLSAGEARGEAPQVTTVRTLLNEIIASWRASHPTIPISYSSDDLCGDPRIISDPVIKQVISNILDNAEEAPAHSIEIAVHRKAKILTIAIRDDGPGFTQQMLSDFGKPYKSSKGKQGGGLGLFLAVNVARKLGGEVLAANAEHGGAIVTLRFPLSSLAIEEKSDAG
jgi:two-component system sensor histidine kinase RegB